MKKNKNTCLYIGVGPRPIHPQHLLAMEKLMPTFGFSDWDLIDKYVVEPGTLNYDATSLPYDDASVDAIYTSHLLEHLGFKEVQSALVEWKRVLAPEGKLMINVPDMEWAAGMLLQMRGLNFNTSVEEPYKSIFTFKESDLFNTPQMMMEVIYGNQDHEGEFHKSGYTKESLKKILEDQGFRNIKIEREFEAHLMGCLIAKAEK